MTHTENQVIEIEPVNNIELRPDRQKEKDSKMKVHPGMLLKTLGKVTHCQCSLLG
jgi:hypothetical protein